MKRTFWKKTVSMVLVFVMFVGILPITAFAAETTEITTEETEQAESVYDETLANFDYVVDDSSQTITLTKYTGNDTTVVVADDYTIDGTVYKTFLQSETVFCNNSTITSVTICSGVSFADNTMCKLFANCANLTSVDMTGVDTSEVTSMRELFSLCTKMQSIIGYEDWDTGKVESIFKTFNQVFRNSKPFGVVIDLTKWDLSNVKNSGWCFQYCQAADIRLPDNLSVISSGFLNHAQKYNGETFTIPAGVKKIGYGHTIYDFGESNFKEFIVAEGNANYVTKDGILYSADGTELLAIPYQKTFEDNTYTIPEGITFLGELSFSRNANIETLILPDSFEIECVEPYDERYIIFEDIGNLNVGTNLTIAIYTFTPVKDYVVRDTNPNYKTVDGILYSKDMTQVVAIPTRYGRTIVIPEGVTTWNKQALWNDTEVSNVWASTTVDNLLSACGGISLPSTIKDIDADQIDLFNRLKKKFGDSFTITVAEDNSFYCVDSEGCLAVKSHTHSYENGVCNICGANHPNLENYKGKVISILGDSISTFAGYIPVADGFNLEHYARYPQDNLFNDVEHTWWMQMLTVLDAQLGINESWRSTEIGNIYDVEVNSGYEGTKACMASITRIQNLGSNGIPDVIMFYGGTNDITQCRTVGVFDPATAPTEVDLTSVKWDTVAEAYVATIMRMQHYYPNAEIIAMLPTFTYKNTNDVIEKYNSVFASICEHYGVTYIDLRECGITTVDLPDGTHPDETGMDYITAAVLDVLLTECNLEIGEHIVHSVSHDLTGAKSSLSYYKGISHGKTFVTTITGENLNVNVSMGGEDITDDCYANGVISIENVTGDVVIVATGEEKTIYDDHLQQLPGVYCSGLNLWTVLEPENQYYTTTGWGNLSNGQVWSITIPVTEGDHIYANSFEKNGSNGNNYSSSNGIRVTYFDTEGVYQSLSPNEVYAEFAANGYLTIPEDVIAVCVPMWTNTDESVVYNFSTEHTYENGTCVVCGHWNGPVITKQPESMQAALGEKFSVTVEAEGEGLTYQWYYSHNGGKSFAASSFKSKSYAMTMATYCHNRQIYCVITDSNGNSVQTETVTITAPLTIIKQPTDVQVKIGEKFSISVQGLGDGLTYQWYYSGNSGKSFAKSSFKGRFYAMTMQSYCHNRQVYCVITDQYGNSVTSDTVTITRPPLELKILTQPVDVYAAKGESFSISAKVQGEGLRYQWYYKESWMNDFRKSSNSGSAYAYTMQNWHDGRQVRCVITDKFGNQVTTDAATIHVEK